MARKLSKQELLDRGYSPTSERYLTDTGEVISKRQYQKLQRGGLTYSKWRKAVAAGTVTPKRPVKARAPKAKGVVIGAKKNRIVYEDINWGQLKRLINKRDKNHLGYSITAQVYSEYMEEETLARYKGMTITTEDIEELNDEGMVWVTIIPYTDPKSITTDKIKRSMREYKTPVTKTKYTLKILLRS